MGEGGACSPTQPPLKKLVESFRDWGRDCWCEPGKDNTCGKRFDWQLGELPYGYDHKYIYSHIGYNLKATDMQAAVGVAQLDKLPGFIAARRRNFARLHAGLARPARTFLILPEADAGQRAELVRLPDRWSGRARRSRASDADRPPRGAEDRHPAALRRQPAPPAGVRRHPLTGWSATWRTPTASCTTRFWIGVYPGLTPPMLDYMVDTIRSWCRR